MRKVVTLYRLIRILQSEVKALRFLEQSVPPNQGSELAKTLYETGQFNMILSGLVIPENYPVFKQEYVWLQKLVAWLFIRRELPEMEDLLEQHYEEEWGYDQPRIGPDELSEKDYHDIGRFLLGFP